jgi:lipopolysaccharide heptosyltransferase II
MKKILVIGPNYMGDVVFTTPAVRAIKLNLPDSYITYFIRKKYGALPVLQDNPDIDEIIAYENRMTPFYLFYKIKREKFDIAFVFATGLKRALIPFLCGIKERVGYINKKRKRFKFLFTKYIDEPDKNQIHRVFYYKKLVDFYFGTNFDVSHYIFIISPEIEKKVREKMKEYKKYYPLICFHPFCEYQWPVENFIKLGKLIKSYFLNLKIIITGTKRKEEYEICEKVYNSLKEISVSFIGETTLKELISVFKNCDLLVIGDTGPLHLACAVNVPVVALFGGSSPRVFGPFGNGKFSVIYKNRVDEILPEEVFEKIKELLK